MKRVLHSTVARHMHKALCCAGELALELQSKNLSQISKGGKDFATEADLAVQELLVSKLGSLLPELKILGEEDSTHEISEEDFIVVDPIDGTFLYSVGSQAWGITIALISNGAPSIGFLYQPARKRMIYAERGHGCYLDGTKINIASNQSLSESIIALAQGCWNTEEEIRKVNVPLSCASLFALCPGSAVDAGFELLQGVCKVYLNYRGNIWDFAGLALAVEEAGGRVCAPNGQARSWNQIESPCLFTASAELQKEVIKLIPEEFQFE